jgi:hypothetical protein
MLGLAQSYSLGLVLLAAIIIFLEFSLGRLIFSKKIILFLLFTFSFFILHFCSILIFKDSVDFSLIRSLNSFFALSLVAVACDLMARRSSAVSFKDFDLIMRRMTYIIVVLGMASSLYAKEAASLLGLHRPIPPFSEPSQFSLAIAPFAIYTFMVRDVRGMLAFALLALIMIFQIFNLTFVGLILILIILKIPKKFLAVGIPLLIFNTGLLFSNIESALSALSLDYYLSRISFENSQNLSVLVFQQGLEIIQDAIAGNNLLGVGFQQLGLVDLDLVTSDIIRRILGNTETLNAYDGGFMAAKIFGEFGLIAVLMTAVLGRVFIKAFNKTHGHHHKIRLLSPHLLFANCCMLTYSIEFLIRGLGYFSIGGTLLLFSLFLPNVSEDRQ